MSMSMSTSIGQATNSEHFSRRVEVESWSIWNGVRSEARALSEQLGREPRYLNNTADADAVAVAVAVAAGLS